MKKIIVLLGIISFAVMAYAADDFPLRAKYPSVTQYMSTAELDSKFADCMVIDSRFKSEYNVIRIKDSLNLETPAIEKDGINELLSLYEKKYIVTYCNGITCPKSYMAAEKLVGLGFNNVYVYDEGVFNWAKAHPEETVYWGNPMTKADVDQLLANKESVKKLSIEPLEFMAKIKSGYVLIDVRDAKDNLGKLAISGTKEITFDKIVEMLERGITKALPDSKFVVVDNVGKQVEWLNYYLVKYGKKDYFFLKGGAANWDSAGYDNKGNKK